MFFLCIYSSFTLICTTGSKNCIPKPITNPLYLYLYLNLLTCLPNMEHHTYFSILIINTKFFSISIYAISYWDWHAIKGILVLNSELGCKTNCSECRWLPTSILQTDPHKFMIVTNPWSQTQLRDAKLLTSRSTIVHLVKSKQEISVQQQIMLTKQKPTP